MSLSKDDILNAIAEMSVMDVVELVEAMEEKFGVSAAASVAAIPANNIPPVMRRNNGSLIAGLTTYQTIRAVRLPHVPGAMGIRPT